MLADGLWDPTTHYVAKLLRLTIISDLAHVEGLWLSLFIFSLSIIVSVVCPTCPHPPLRLARRPNRGHMGGPLLRYMPMMFLSRVGSALPPSSTVKSMHEDIIYYVTKSALCNNGGLKLVLQEISF